ncbi:hypothetical protein [Parachlamydia sp. AcF125]|uniref:hypothetical protein n=1 Tax=Parachlamydia sp. AcF125 TaxID=2795736 RepID=UPI001BC946BF|nr:hypothetical protein [Parachlamydia sp. AcF125]MBS4168462.1 hypothetical protein [Parachlamydia sp. AcF125]
MDWKQEVELLVSTPFPLTKKEKHLRMRGRPPYFQEYKLGSFWHLSQAFLQSYSFSGSVTALIAV